ncbi:hypothetical protein Peur_009153 [Populus x canadensis]
MSHMQTARMPMAKRARGQQLTEKSEPVEPSKQVEVGEEDRRPNYKQTGKEQINSAEAVKLCGGKIVREPGPKPVINTKITASLDPEVGRRKRYIIYQPLQRFLHHIIQSHHHHHPILCLLQTNFSVKNFEQAPQFCRSKEGEYDNLLLHPLIFPKPAPKCSLSKDHLPLLPLCEEATSSEKVLMDPPSEDPPRDPIAKSWLQVESTNDDFPSDKE